MRVVFVSWYNLHMMTTDNTISEILDDIATGTVDLDFIADNAVNFLIADYDLIMDAARVIDPTESGVAADIRNAMRDNM